MNALHTRLAVLEANIAKETGSEGLDDDSSTIAVDQ
jgi:hypothetical protein